MPTEHKIRIGLSIALILAIVFVGAQFGNIASELTRIRATMEKSVYGAVQENPNY